MEPLGGMLEGLCQRGARGQGGGSSSVPGARGLFKNNGILGWSVGVGIPTVGRPRPWF